MVMEGSVVADAAEATNVVERGGWTVRAGAVVVSICAEGGSETLTCLRDDGGQDARRYFSLARR